MFHARALCAGARMIRTYGTSSRSTFTVRASQLQLGQWVKAGITSGSLSALGDVIAQTLVKHKLSKDYHKDRPYDLQRTARMLSFGLLWYGPFQHFWYGLLAKSFPGTTISSFVTKVALNQLVLGPLVLTTAFSWNLVLQNKAQEIVSKCKADFFPTLVNGWIFWVPAACVNFFTVPVKFQVLWMSLCGVVWTGYISFASYNSANAIKVD